MKYYRVKETARRDGVLGAITPVEDVTKNISGFVGRNQLDSLPFGYINLEGKNGLILEVKKEFLEDVEEFDYETCKEYRKVI